MRKNCLPYLKWFFPLLFIAYLGTIIPFTHVHIENGVTIVHAHPFKQAADGTMHKHTCVEFQLINQLSILLTEEAPLDILLAAWLTVVSVCLCRPVRVSLFRSLHGNQLLRAPPVAA